jgi:hypothetical protein
MQMGGGAGQAVSAHALIGTMHRMNVQNVDRPEHFVRMFLHPVLMAPPLSRRVTARASSGLTGLSFCCKQPSSVQSFLDHRRA